MRVLYRLVLYILIVFATVACVNDKEEPVWSLQPGDRLPDFEVVMSDGRRITTESLKGKHSVIVFFNTSCSDCRREHVPHTGNVSFKAKNRWNSSAYHVRKMRRQ